MRPSIIETIRARSGRRLEAALRSAPDALCSGRPLLEAARLGWRDGIRVLLRHGADPNRSYRGYRPLHALIQEESRAGARRASRTRLACLDLLLAHGADPEQLAAWPPARAVLVAAFAGEIDFVAHLIDQGATVDGFVEAALGAVREVERILRRDRSFARARDRSGLTALQCCAASRLGARDPMTARDLAAVAERLVKAGADVNALTSGWDHDLDPMCFAVSSGQRTLALKLIEWGADPTRALSSALWSGERELADAALAAGGELDRAMDHGKPLLNQLVRWGQVRPALWMLERGASPNLPDERGWTAVHQAASRGSERLLRAVLAASGDRRARDRSGSTPLDVARSRGRAKLVKLLSA
jgi:ankyrin repeat protein